MKKYRLAQCVEGMESRESAWIKAFKINAEAP